MSYGKKDDDADLGLVKVDRTQVFQEARLFNSSPIQPRRCRILLTKIALLLYTGEKFPTNEATTLFFGISKLFQNKDASLRQMVHLVIKEIANSAEDIIMVTSTIMKDTGGSTDAIFRPNAIRALCRIIDATTVQSIERVMKTAIVDKNPSVSSAALVSSYHLLPIAKDVVRRWQSEAQEAAASTKSSGGFSLGFSSSSSSGMPVNNSTMTQYHAIGLLYQMRSHDRMALVRMVQQFGAAGAIKSPAAIVMLVRLAAQLAEEDQSLRRPMMTLLDGWLRHKSEMVNFEAAKAICDMRDVTDAEVTQAVHVLQLFLSSPRAVTKFAALRILHNFASFKPQAVNVCNPDIEALISNSNRSIATFAITTLLKTGNEASVDRLMKQITGFMSEITDEFKITIVEAIRTLCLKFPSKQAGMLAFLSGILRDEGGYEFKRAVVESMFDLIKFVPDSKEDALAHLCEFIEDCEFTKLAVRILHLLGLEGPKTSQPTKYIRYIYNRVVLENAIVRAAAVTALAKFGVGQKDPEVKRSVDVLLTRCLDDVDDEVRDRAALNLRLMHEEDEMGERFIKNENMYSLPYFEHQLVMYVTSEDKSAFETPFDISKIPVVTREQADAEDRTKKLTATAPSLKPPKTGPSKAAATGPDAQATAAAAAQKYAQELMAIPEMKEFGSVLKSSAVVELTEAETEYVVTVVKHIFKEHIVLQYEVKNTLPDTVLENVSVVAMPSEEEELEEVFIIQAEKLATDEPGKIFVAFKKAGGEGTMPTSTFSNILKFTSKEIDPTTNEPEETGYDDEYEVGEFDLAGSDYVIPTYAGNFNHVWEQVGASGEEAQETLQLSDMSSIADATEQLAKALSLQPLEGTDVPVNQTTHQLKLLGKTVNGGRVVANIRMAYSSKSGVTTKIVVRSEEENVAAMVVASVA
ncbi:adaptin N terminal region-domain-containing protein [Xylariomycetidae sp. FL0641]|nr:adaptin N terminal region-domain-containing protein [Xylariomycetidae sp. FL0641]